MNRIAATRVDGDAYEVTTDEWARAAGATQSWQSVRELADSEITRRCQGGEQAPEMIVVVNNRRYCASGELARIEYHVTRQHPLGKMVTPARAQTEVVERI